MISLGTLLNNKIQHYFMENFEYLISDKLKLKVLIKLQDKKFHTPSELSIKLNTTGTTLLRNCKFLKLLNLIEIDVKKTKGINYFLKITERGSTILDNNQELLQEN